MSNHRYSLRWRPRDRMEFLSNPWLQPTVISGRRPLFLRVNHNVRRHEPRSFVFRLRPNCECCGRPASTRRDR